MRITAKQRNMISLLVMLALVIYVLSSVGILPPDLEAYFAYFWPVLLLIWGISRLAVPAGHRSINRVRRVTGFLAIGLALFALGRALGLF